MASALMRNSQNDVNCSRQPYWSGNSRSCQSLLRRYSHWKTSQSVFKWSQNVAVGNNAQHLGFRDGFAISNCFFRSCSLRDGQNRGNRSNFLHYCIPIIPSSTSCLQRVLKNRNDLKFTSDFVLLRNIAGQNNHPIFRQRVVIHFASGADAWQ